MASLINAVRNIMSDSLWGLKILLLSVPVYLLLTGDKIFKNNPSGFLYISLFVFILYLGCASFLMNRNINNKTPILPNLFSIPEVLIKAVSVSLVMFPASLVLYAVVSYVYQNIVFEPFIMFIIYSIITIIMAPFIFIPAVLFSVRGKITDAFRLNLILEGAGNFQVSFMSFIIQYLFTFVLFEYLLFVLFKEMLGPDNIIIYIITAILLTVSFFAVFSYFSDLYEDIIPVVQSKRDIL